MSDRLRKILTTSGAALFLALVCSFGCGCLAGESPEEGDDGYAYAELDEPTADEEASAPAAEADQVIAGELDLGDELAALEARYQAELHDGSSHTLLGMADGDGEGEGRRSNPEPTPWEPGAEDNPEPTPWHGGSAGDDMVNPEPTPWLTDDDDDVETSSAFAADSTGGSGWSHGDD